MNYEILASIAATDPAPDSSWILIADVRGSTEAVRQGRYRDVNLIGAACVAAIRNNYDSRKVPYVFGGDGATFLVAHEDLERCRSLLENVQQMARDSFQLQLGVGAMQVAEIRRRGGNINYGFLDWGETEVLPFFRGDGLAMAEKLIKDNMKSPPAASEGQAPTPAIEGLSCRLMPFNAVRGQVLSVVIEPTVDFSLEDQVFKQVFSVFKRAGDIDRLSPLSLGNIRRSWLGTQWIKEARMHRRSIGVWDTASALFDALAAYLFTTILFRFKLRTTVIGDVDTYNKFMLQQSDWMKMDSALRMVIDVTAEEEAQLREVLERLEGEGQLVYGLFASASALMTCHFQSVEGQKHAHFIDGADGGLTLAAKDLKIKKLRAAALAVTKRAS